MTSFAEKQAPVLQGHLQADETLAARLMTGSGALGRLGGGEGQQHGAAALGDWLGRLGR